MSRNQSGFTILEVLVATLILAGGLVVITSSWGGNYSRLQKSRINNTMAHLLQQKMVEVELEYKGKPIDQIKEEESGTFDEYKGFSWVVKSQDFDMPDLSSAIQAKSGENGVNDQILMIVKQVTDYIRKTVKEVTVTVTYKSPTAKRPISQDVTTYFIDYQKDVPLVPGGAGGS